MLAPSSIVVRVNLSGQTSVLLTREIRLANSPIGVVMNRVRHSAVELVERTPSEVLPRENPPPNKRSNSLNWGTHAQRGSTDLG